MAELISASEFSRNFGRYKDQAIEDRVVEVSSNGRRVGAFLSQGEYEHYLRLKARETRVFRIDELPDDLVRDIEHAEYGVVDQ